MALTIQGIQSICGTLPVSSRKTDRTTAQTTVMEMVMPFLKRAVRP